MSIREPRFDEAASREEETAAMFKHLEAMQSDVREMQADLWRRREKSMGDLAGPLLDEFRTDRDRTIQHFAHPEASVRDAAIQFANDYWGLTKPLANEYERLALTDPDMDVRSSATTALSSCYSNTRDTRIGRVFAGIVSDEALPDELRMEGFMALVALDGDCISSPFIGIESLSSLDWSLVRAYSR